MHDIKVQAGCVILHAIASRSLCEDMFNTYCGMCCAGANATACGIRIRPRAPDQRRT